jgi:hypothetical protein
MGKKILFVVDGFGKEVLFPEIILMRFGFAF